MAVNILADIVPIDGNKDLAFETDEIRPEFTREVEHMFYSCRHYTAGEVSISMASQDLGGVVTLSKLKHLLLEDGTSIVDSAHCFV